MKSAIFFLLLIFINTSAHSQNSSEVCYNPNLVKDTTKKSITSMAFQIVNGDSIKISYHSPGVRKRIVWGGLVPFDEVWVTGAHDATYIIMPHAFEVAGKNTIFPILRISILAKQISPEFTHVSYWYLKGCTC